MAGSADREYLRDADRDSPADEATSTTVAPNSLPAVTPYDETQPTKTLAEMVRADERLKKGFPSITLPVLILHGTADQVAVRVLTQYSEPLAGLV